MVNININVKKNDTPAIVGTESLCELLLSGRLIKFLLLTIQLILGIRKVTKIKEPTNVIIAMKIKYSTFNACNVNPFLQIN
jgi:hypothetical protein